MKNDLKLLEIFKYDSHDLKNITNWGYKGSIKNKLHFSRNTNCVKRAWNRNLGISSVFYLSYKYASYLNSLMFVSSIFIRRNCDCRELKSIFGIWVQGSSLCGWHWPNPSVCLCIELYTISFDRCGRYSPPHWNGCIEESNWWKANLVFQNQISSKWVTLSSMYCSQNFIFKMALWPQNRSHS